MFFCGVEEGVCLFVCLFSHAQHSFLQIIIMPAFRTETVYLQLYTSANRFVKGSSIIAIVQTIRFAPTDSSCKTSFSHDWEEAQPSHYLQEKQERWESTIASIQSRRAPKGPVIGTVLPDAKQLLSVWAWPKSRGKSITYNFTAACLFNANKLLWNKKPYLTLNQNLYKILIVPFTQE